MRGEERIKTKPEEGDEIRKHEERKDDRRGKESRNNEDMREVTGKEDKTRI